MNKVIHDEKYIDRIVLQFICEQIGSGQAAERLDLTYDDFMRLRGSKLQDWVRAGLLVPTEEFINQTLK